MWRARIFFSGPWFQSLLPASDKIMQDPVNERFRTSISVRYAHRTICAFKSVDFSENFNHDHRVQFTFLLLYVCGHVKNFEIVSHAYYLCSYCIMQFLLLYVVTLVIIVRVKFRVKC